MKRLIILAAFASLAFSSCTKENEIVVSADNTPNKVVVKDTEIKKEGKIVTVKVTSGEASQVEITSVAKADFDETYTKTYTLTGKTVSVKLYSEMPSMKSIAIYVDGTLETMRSATCASSDYELTYELAN